MKSHWVLALLLPLALSGFASVITEVPAIFVFAGVFTLIGALICQALPGTDGGIRSLYSIGLLLRALVAYGSWALFVNGNRSHAAFGTDGQFFFETSFMPMDAETYELANFRGYIIYNQIATSIAELLGGSHYLANLQWQLVAGALVGPLVYAVSSHLGRCQAGRIAAIICTFHPSLIALSSVLIRDSVVSMLGMLLILQLLQSRGQSLWQVLRGWSATTVLLIVIGFFRIPSAVFFAAAGGIVVWLAGRTLRQRRTFFLGQMAPVIILSTLAAVLLMGTAVVSSTSREIQRDLRLDQSDASGSVAVSVLSANPIVYTIGNTLYHFIAPFPFFKWNEDPMASLLDALLGLGGLLNQFLFVLMLAGIVLAYRSRPQRPLLSLIVLCTGMAAASSSSFGDQARYFAAHAFPFLALFVGQAWIWLGNKRGAVLLHSFIGLSCTYVAYAGHKAGFGGWVVRGPLLLSVFLIFLVIIEAVTISQQKALEPNLG